MEKIIEELEVDQSIISKFEKNLFLFYEEIFKTFLKKLFFINKTKIKLKKNPGLEKI